MSLPFNVMTAMHIHITSLSLLYKFSIQFSGGISPLKVLFNMGYYVELLC